MRLFRDDFLIQRWSQCSRETYAYLLVAQFTIETDHHTGTTEDYYTLYEQCQGSNRAFGSEKT